MMSWKIKRRIGRFIGGAVVFLILAYLVMPSVVVIGAAFGPQETLSFPPQGFSLRWFVKAFNYHDFQRGFKNSMIVMSVAAFAAAAVGTGFVYAAERFPFRGVETIRTLLLAPLVVPHFIFGLAGLILASYVGLVRTYFVVIVLHVIVALPFVIRSVLVSLQAIDPALERAAVSLGASPARVFWSIYVPLMAPGLFGALLFAAILSFTEFSGSLFMTGQPTQTLPVAMYAYTRDFADPTLAAVATIFIAIIGGLLIVAMRWLGLARILSVQHER